MLKIDTSDFTRGLPVWSILKQVGHREATI